jgi:hypothetical protein
MMSNALTTTSPAQLQIMAKAVTESGLFGLKNQNQAFTLMLIAEAEGIPAIKAVQMYSIINGMPSLKSTEVQARFQKSGGKIQWIETTEKKAVCKMSHPDGGEYTSEFSIEMAKQMGLSSKDNWVKMPKQMLMARAITSGVRALYPSCLNNMYAYEEAIDMPKEDIIETEIEDEEPKKDLSQLKFRLSKRLKDLSLSTADVKAFALKFELTENADLIDEILNDENKLIEMVKEFENGN